MVITFRHGQAEYVAHPDLAAVFGGGVRSRRASHVEPVSPVLRAAFRLIRRSVADTSPLAGWTRRWPCRWRVDLTLSGGPVFGAFSDRQAAIAAEVDWIEQHVL